MRRVVMLGALSTLAVVFSWVPPCGAHQLHDVYLVAHADDWQLFHAPNAVIDIANGERVVFIQASASDAGRTDGYWQAREEGARASVRWVVGAGAAEREERLAICGAHRCRDIVLWTYGPVASVYLRLPDGAGEGAEGCGAPGSGTPAYDCRSLGRLRDGDLTLTAVDGSTSYDSWQELVETVAAVGAALGVPDDRSTWLNAPEFDRGLNPGDHPDHHACGDLARALLARRAWSVALAVGYDGATRPANLSQDDHDTKMGLYFSYYIRLVDLIGFTTTEVGRLETGYAAWLWRNYFRTP